MRPSTSILATLLHGEHMLLFKEGTVGTMLDPSVSAGARMDLTFKVMRLLLIHHYPPSYSQPGH